MKTNKKRMLNIVIAVSVVMNLVLLGGVSYIASLDRHVNEVCSTMSLPVMVYVSKSVEISGGPTSTKLSVKP